MLHVRRGFGDEKAQLNELNKRLNQYLSRVRQLEGENQVLVDEIHRLRQERGAEWTENYYDELCQLRRKVEELSVQKCEAELQKDNLWQEIQDLQGLWEQVRSMRLRIDKQLELYKQDLQQAKSNQAALEELYFRLQQECQILQTSQKEELFALRDQALQMPLQITMQEVVRPRLSLMDVQSLALELSESWKEAFLVYQKKIQELENTLRLDEVHCLGVDEEVRIQKLHIKELRREYEELLGIQKTLEKELLRMKDKYRLEVEEYQIIIEELEIERQTITITITDRLKDYHDLMQVKTGLNLEVAAYRALLEAESKKGTVIWTESSMRNRPAGYVTSAFEKSTNYSNRGIKYPITGHKEEIRRNMETTNIDRFLTRTLPQPQIRSKYSQLGNTSSSYVSHVYENTTQDKSGRWDTSFPSRYDISNKTFPQTMYRLEQPTVATPFLPTQSTLINETTKEQTVKDLKPVARPRTHSKEAKKVDVHIRTEDRKQDTISQRTLETKVTEEMRATSQPVEEIQQTLEINLHNIEKDNTISEEATSVAKSVTKDMIQEPKPQELPVKKERKKREQAKKRKGELEKVDIGEMDVAEESRAEVHDTTHVTKTVALGEKESEGAENQQIVLEIPIELKARKTENITQKRYMEDKAQQNFSYMNVNDKSMFLGNVDSLKAHKTNITEDSDVTTISGQREKGTLHDDIFRHLGHSSVIDESETNVISVEKKQQDSGSGTTIFGESMQREQVVLDIPIRYEGRKREVSSEIENVEHSEHSRLSGNFKQTNVSEEAFLKNQEAINANENYEDNAKCTVESEVADSSSEPNGKKAMVADILRQLGQPTALDDSNVIYVEREEQCSDGFVKTQIFVQSKTEEEFDLFDEPDLTDLWNTTIIQSPTETVPGSIGSQSEETGSRTTKKTILKDVTGAQAEEWIGNVIHSGLKTGTGKSINVEIVEESFETFGYEKGDFSTPFHVEEAEDNFNIEESVITEQHSSMPTKKLQDETQLRKGPSQVEEVKEGEHVDEETDYFVYVPDDIPCLEEEEDEEETLRGQIHTEEESHVKYSWQDEFLQGSQGRKSLSDLLKNAMTTEQSSASEYTSDENIKRLVNAEKEQSHTESIVIERKIEVPQEIKSSIMNLLSKDNKNPQETLKGALDCLQGKLPQDLVDELSTLAEEEQTQNSSLTVDIKKVGQTEEKGMVTIVAEINVSQTVDTDNIDMLELVKDVQSEVTAIHKSNIKSDDITSFLHTQNENVTCAKESDKYQESYHSVTMGTDNGAKHYITEEISVKGPTNPSILYSPTRELSIGQISTDVNKFIKHIELSTQENVTCEETGTEQGSAGELSPTEINRSEHHFTIGPREMLSKKQIIFEGPISETLKLDIVKNTEDYSDQNRSIRHIKISPTENYPTEKIIFHGSIFKTSGTGGNVTGGLSVKDNYADNVSQIDQTLVYRENQSGDQEKIIQGNDYIAGTSNTISHFKINSGEMSKEILLEGSIPRPNDLSRHITLDPEDKGAPIEFNFATQKVHVAKQIKYQGYVSEPQSTENTGSFVQSKDQSNINTSVHHIKLSPSREQIVFEGPMLPNFQFREADGAHMENKNRSISHIQLGSPDSHTSECITFEGPTRETYESSEYIVSSPSGDSSESERSIKHIKLGPTEKSFIFQMDITKIATQHTGEERTQESSMVITSSKTEGQQKSSQSYNELKDDSEVAESGYGMEEMAGISQFPYNITSHQYIGDMSEVEKTVQLQRIVQQSHMVSDDKKVAVVFLDDGDDEEEPDQDYLRRSF